MVASSDASILTDWSLKVEFKLVGGVTEVLSENAPPPRRFLDWRNLGD